MCFFFSYNGHRGLFEGMMFEEEQNQPGQKLQGKVCQAEGPASPKALQQEKSLAGSSKTKATVTLR